MLALEVWRPGVADTLGRVGRGRRRERAAAPRSTPSGRWSTWSRRAELAELWTFFPDPWHKKRHHKRRLVTPAFARLAATRLAPGGGVAAGHGLGATTPSRWSRCSTPSRRSTGGVVERWEERPVTKFERKGVAAGREITDLAYRRA